MLQKCFFDLPEVSSCCHDECGNVKTLLGRRKANDLFKDLSMSQTVRSQKLHNLYQFLYWARCKTYLGSNHIKIYTSVDLSYLKMHISVSGFR